MKRTHSLVSSLNVVFKLIYIDILTYFLGEAFCIQCLGYPKSLSVLNA